MEAEGRRNIHGGIARVTQDKKRRGEVENSEGERRKRRCGRRDADKKKNCERRESKMESWRYEK